MQGSSASASKLPEESTRGPSQSTPQDTDMDDLDNTAVAVRFALDLAERGSDYDGSSDDEDTNGTITLYLTQPLCP